MNYNVPRDLIVRVISTLKEMDVRGFDSMNRLVGLVMLFESILNTPVEAPAMQPVADPGPTPNVMPIVEAKQKKEE